MPLVPEIPIFWIILKLLDPENENIKFSKNIFQAPWNSTSACKINFFYKNEKYESRSFKKAYKRLIWTKSHANRGNWFWAKYGDFQNIENIKKNEVFQLQTEVGKKVVTSEQWKVWQKIRIAPYFLAPVTKMFFECIANFFLKK